MATAVPTARLCRWSFWFRHLLVERPLLAQQGKHERVLGKIQVMYVPFSNSRYRFSSNILTFYHLGDREGKKKEKKS